MHLELITACSAIPVRREVSALFLADNSWAHETARVKSRDSLFSFCVGTVALFVLAISARAASPVTNWPQFRGADALGVADNSNLPDRWSTNENVAWKIEMPGRGWSSPIVWGERLFVTTVVSEGEVEPAKKGLYFGGERKDIAKGEHHWLVL